MLNKARDIGEVVREVWVALARSETPQGAEGWEQRVQDGLYVVLVL